MPRTTCPSKVLERLFLEAGYASREQLVKAMDAKIADRLLAGPELAGLAAFVTRHLESGDGVNASAVAPGAPG